MNYSSFSNKENIVKDVHIMTENEALVKSRWAFLPTNQKRRKCIICKNWVNLTKQ